MDLLNNVTIFFIYKILTLKIPLFNTIFKSLIRNVLSCLDKTTRTHQCAHALCGTLTDTPRWFTIPPTDWRKHVQNQAVKTVEQVFQAPSLWLVSPERKWFLQFVYHQWTTRQTLSYRSLSLSSESLFKDEKALKKVSEFRPTTSKYFSNLRVTNMIKIREYKGK